MPNELLRTVEQIRTRFRLRHACELLEHVLLLLLRALQLVVQVLRRELAVVHALLAAGQLGQLAVEVELDRRDPLFRSPDLRAPDPELVVDLGAQGQLALTGLDLRLTANRLRLPLGLGDQECPAPTELAESALLQHRDRDHSGGHAHDDPDCDSRDDEQRSSTSEAEFGCQPTRQIRHRGSEVGEDGSTPPRRDASASPSVGCSARSLGVVQKPLDRSNVRECSVSDQRKMPVCRKNVG